LVKKIRRGGKVVWSGDSGDESGGEGRRITERELPSARRGTTDKAGSGFWPRQRLKVRKTTRGSGKKGGIKTPKKVRRK